MTTRAVNKKAVDEVMTTRMDLMMITTVGSRGGKGDGVGTLADRISIHWHVHAF